MKLAAATFDVGGIIYSDDVFKRAIYAAMENFAGPIDAARFEKVYDDHLKSQSGSLRSKLCMEFFGSLELKGEIMEFAIERWNFEPSDIYNDAKATIEELKASGLKIGLVANQPKSAVDSLKRDGIFDLVDFLGISAVVGLEKPNPRIFELALTELGTKAAETIHIGNRLDTDVIPAKALGFKTVWILRGEANPTPSQEDLKVPDIVATDLINLAEQITKL
ncbi:MAG: HAD family hydrolase [Actinomycetales bacterium]|nr:MAG: HAD family hydrolase [Actinomycetales bacterium]